MKEVITMANKTNGKKPVEKVVKELPQHDAEIGLSVSNDKLFPEVATIMKNLFGAEMEVTSIRKDGDHKTKISGHSKK